MRHPAIPAYKYALSYLVEQRICCTSSAYHSLLEVVLSSGRLRLNTTHATYSFEDKYDVFFDTFQHLQLPRHSLSNVLVLGLGLGSVPQMLQQHFGQNAHYRAVELDPAIVQLAQQWLPPDVWLHLSVSCANALSWVAQAAAQQPPALLYDMIVMDIFMDLDTPPAFFEATFLLQLQQLLAPQGWLLFNTLCHDLSTNRQSEQFYQHTFLPTLKNTHYWHTSGNRVLVCQHKQDAMGK